METIGEGLARISIPIPAGELGWGGGAVVSCPKLTSAPICLPLLPQLAQHLALSSAREGVFTCFWLGRENVSQWGGRWSHWLWWAGLGWSAGQLCSSPPLLPALRPHCPHIPLRLPLGLHLLGQVLIEACRRCSGLGLKPPSLLIQHSCPEDLIHSHTLQPPRGVPVR